MSTEVQPAIKAPMQITAIFFISFKFLGKFTQKTANNETMSNI